jgi:pimeloyl-ACP methyl ester carboxylesterase
MTSLEAWARSGGFFTWRGHRVFFRDEGAGEPLLLLHGVPTASWIWHRVWPHLLPGRRLLALDLIGFGLSDKPPDLVADVMAQADLCQDLLISREVARYHLLAEDYGATVAQELLARGGEPAIATLCLLNGGIFPEAQRPLLMQRLIGARLGRPLARFVLRRPFWRSLTRLFGPHTKPDRATLEALWQLLIHNRGRRVLPAMMAYREARGQHRARWVGALTGAEVPCRFVSGVADPVCGEEMRALWRAHVPGGDVVELPGIGHWPALEAPEAVAAAVLALPCAGW